jgi:hypothetical protein
MNYEGCKRKFDVKGFVRKYPPASANSIKASNNNFESKRSKKIESKVLTLKSALESAMTDNDVVKALDILHALNSIAMNLDLLKSTLVGATVANSRKAFVSDEVLTSLAKQIVSKWKACVSSTPAATVKAAVVVAATGTENKVDVSEAPSNLPEIRVKV